MTTLTEHWKLCARAERLGYDGDIADLYEMQDYRRDCQACGDPDTHEFLSTDYPPVWLCDVHATEVEDPDDYRDVVQGR